MVTLGDPTWLKKHLYYPVYILMVSWNRGTSRAGWFIMENPIIESGWFRCTPILGNLRIYIYTLGDPGSPVTAHRLLLRCRWSRCIMLRDRAGWGVGWGALSFVECWSRCWCSAADDHVVSCSATGRGGGWGVLSVVQNFHRSGTVACDRRYWMQGAGVSSTGWFLVRQSLDWFWWLFNGDNRNN